MWKWRDTHTVWGPSDLQNSRFCSSTRQAYFSFPFSDIFILRFPYLYSMTHTYSYVVVIPSHSFLPLSTLGRMFTPNMVARIRASTWTRFLWLSRTVITGVTKAHRGSLGLCLLILQCVAYFKYQFPILSNSLILKLRLKISSCIMSKSRLISL